MYYYKTACELVFLCGGQSPLIKVSVAVSPTVNVSVMLLQMNLALIHDRLHIKSFWEKRINADCQYAENEEQRMNKSALKKSVTHLTAQHHTITHSYKITKCGLFKVENVSEVGSALM